MTAVSAGVLVAVLLLLGIVITAGVLVAVLLLLGIVITCISCCCCYKSEQKSDSSRSKKVIQQTKHYPISIEHACDTCYSIVYTVKGYLIQTLYMWVFLYS